MDLKSKLLHSILKTCSPKRERILFVDDDEPLRELFVFFFEERGYRVTTAGSIAEAEAKLQAEPFDLVLQDVMLPDGDGLDFVPRIRAIQPGIPIIVLSGLGYQETVLQHAIEQRATSYISKVLPIDQVLMEIHRVLKFKKTPPVTAPAQQVA